MKTRYTHADNHYLQRKALHYQIYICRHTIYLTIDIGLEHFCKSFQKFFVIRLRYELFVVTLHFTINTFEIPLY